MAELTSFSGIPSVVYRDPGIEPSRLVLHYHGWNGEKLPDPEIQSLFEAASRRGVVVVCPDCLWHGERQDPELRFRKVFNGWAFICEVMEAARRESPGLCRAIFTQLGLPALEVRVSGISMGGLIAQLVLLELPECREGLSILGRSSFHQADPWCRQAQKGTEWEAWCDRHAPLSNPERYRDRRLRFLDGGRDSDCPAEINRATVGKIRGAGGDASQWVDPDAGHLVSAAMRERFAQWLAAGLPTHEAGVA